MAIGNGFTGNRDSTNIIKVFISNFISPDFFSSIINMCLYPAEFNVTISNNNSLINFIKDYLKDITLTSNNLKIQNLNQIKEYINLVSTILNIRESGQAIITYDNVFQHVPSVNLSQRQIIQNAINNKLSENDEFRILVDKIINEISIYNELTSVSTNIIEFDNICERIKTSPNISPYEIAKLYKENIIQQYTNLSELKSINKLETEKDYFVISDKKSIKDLANTLVTYITGDYSFYGTGYALFDNHIEGFESSSVHLVTAPSNHGKSLTNELIKFYEMTGNSHL